MNPSCLVSTVQAGGGDVIMWRVISYHTLDPLSIATAYLSVVGDHELQDNEPCYKAQMISKRVWLSCKKTSLFFKLFRVSSGSHQNNYLKHRNRSRSQFGLK